MATLIKIRKRRSSAPRNVAGFRPAELAGDCRYRQENAEHVLEFMRHFLRHVKGPKTGEPIEMEPWQEDLIKTLFGWRRPDGTRRFRQSFIFVPRKNGKTTVLAAIVTYCLFCERQSREGAELYCAAFTRDQASLLFQTVAAFVQRSQTLQDRAQINRSLKRINLVENGLPTETFFRALPAEPGAAHGFNSTMIACDELHAWKGREFYDVLQTSFGSRREPLSIDITTAGYERESICYLQYKYACGVRDGTIRDAAFLPVIYEAAESEDWQDPAVWKKANPNLGVSLSIDYLARECKRAQETKSYENTFRRLHLNQWTSQETRFLQMDRWRALGGQPRELAGQECYGGLDLSSRIDLTAFVLAFPKDDGGYILLPRFWIPEGSALKIERADRVPYSNWARQDLITITSGESVDYGVIHRQLLEDAQRYDLKQVAYDPWNAEASRQYLESEGLTMIETRQVLKTLSAPMKELERSIIAGTLEHWNHPVLSWQGGNLDSYTDNSGNIKPVKPRHDAHRLKIDGMVAAIMAIGLAMLRQAEPGTFDASSFLLLEAEKDFDFESP